MSVDVDQILDWRGRTVVDRDGRRVGTFREVYLDEGTSAPTWAAVKVGPLGLRRRVVPITDADSDGNRVRVPFTKEQVLSAPAIDTEGWVPESDQSVVFRHYGIQPPRRRRDPAERVSVHDDGGAPDPEPASNRPADSEARPSDHDLSRFRLKRHTVTETVTRRSEFEED